MEQKDSRWHKKTVGGTKSQSVEQNHSRWGIFRQSVPYHPGAADQLEASNTVDSYTAVDRYTAVRDMTIYTTRGGHHQHQGPHGTAAILGQSE